jgi:hypothetical protein
MTYTTPPKIVTLLSPAPPNLPVAPTDYNQVYQDQILNALRLYFNQLNNFTNGVITPPSGTTTQRPTLKLQTGQFFFDTTLGIPIYWSGTKWVNSSGTAV